VHDESTLPLGPEPAAAAGGVAESRAAGAAAPFDNVSDYNGLNTGASVTGTAGTAMPAGYNAAVTVAQAALGTVAAANALLITVTVTRGTDNLVLQGYRARHSPNGLP
jgi:hypothetical protein